MEPLSTATLVGGLTLGATFTLGGILVGKAVNYIEKTVDEYIHPKPKYDNIDKELKNFDEILKQYEHNSPDKPKIKNF